MTDPGGHQWSDPPKVPKDDAEDFDALAGEGPYEGMTLAQAQQTFTRNNLDWDQMTPDKFKAVIGNLRKDVRYSDGVGPACFVFCDHKIPEQYRRAWVIAIMAARDVHEGND